MGKNAARTLAKVAMQKSIQFREVYIVEATTWIKPDDTDLVLF
jgi:hypothetical protein